MHNTTKNFIKKYILCVCIILANLAPLVPLAPVYGKPRITKRESEVISIPPIAADSTENKEISYKFDIHARFASGNMHTTQAFDTQLLWYKNNGYTALALSTEYNKVLAPQYYYDSKHDILIYPSVNFITAHVKLLFIFPSCLLDLAPLVDSAAPAVDCIAAFKEEYTTFIQPILQRSLYTAMSKENIIQFSCFSIAELEEIIQIVHKHHGIVILQANGIEITADAENNCMNPIVDNLGLSPSEIRNNWLEQIIKALDYIETDTCNLHDYYNSHIAAIYKKKALAGTALELAPIDLSGIDLSICSNGLHAEYGRFISGANGTSEITTTTMLDDLKNSFSGPYTKNYSFTNLLYIYGLCIIILIIFLLCQCFYIIGYSCCDSLLKNIKYYICCCFQSRSQTRYMRPRIQKRATSSFGRKKNITTKEFIL